MTTERDRGDGRPSPARLYRRPAEGWIRGVCAGLAAYLGVRVWIVRAIAVVLLFLFPVPAIIGYIVLGAVLEREPEHLYDSPGDEAFWRGVRNDPSATFESLRHRFRELERRLQGLESHVTSPGFRVRRNIDEL